MLNGVFTQFSVSEELPDKHATAALMLLQTDAVVSNWAGLEQTSIKRGKRDGTR